MRKTDHDITITIPEAHNHQHKKNKLAYASWHTTSISAMTVYSLLLNFFTVYNNLFIVG